MVSSNNPSGCGLNHSVLGGGCGTGPEAEGAAGSCFRLPGSRGLLGCGGPGEDSLAPRRRGALGRSVRPLRKLGGWYGPAESRASGSGFGAAAAAEPG